MRRLTAWILAAILAFGATALAETRNAPLLWRARDGAGHTLYLFGTIHAADESAYPLSDPVTAAFEASDALALELDVSTAPLKILMIPGYAQAMFLSGEDSIDARLSPETVEALDRYMADCGVPRIMYNKMSPMAVYSLLEEYITKDSGLSTELGIDNRLAAMAKERDMPLLEIESAEFQFGLLAGFSDELYDLMIGETAARPGAAARQLAGLFSAWRSGNSTLLALYNSAETFGAAPEEAALIEEFTKRMLTDRNIGMADFAENSLASGQTVFLAVGAGHMIGPGGIIALLRERGYIIEEIGR